jgi:hypothetical protein
LANIAGDSSSYRDLALSYGPTLTFNWSSYKTVWALANIAGDSSSYRDLALSYGALPQLLAQFKETVNISLIRNATWALSNFCLGKPQPQFDQVKRIH